MKAGGSEIWLKGWVFDKQSIEISLFPSQTLLMIFPAMQLNSLLLVPRAFTKSFDFYVV